ncbi:MAG: hypothetical protein KKF98_07370 [Bacteroidetes bacterium]|nr:hypothetical protein [Bacteroidota bacterium]
MKPVIFTLLMLFTLGLYCQSPQTSFVLDEPVNHDVTKDYVASQYIQMIPNFWAHSDEDHHVWAKIDPLLVFPPEDGEETGGASNNNLGGVVGTLPGNLMVSPTGAAVYNIPIEVPPGVAGMTPQLSLVYNSQGGNGLLGVGWSLSGLSAITRTGTTLYHDGFIDGVDFDENDRFMLDGKRLIPVNETETEFRTENETFSKITAVGTAGSGPEQFVVKTKSGQILYYGSEPTGRIEAEGRTSILTWCLNKIEDRKGNYIDFSYIETGGMGIIDEIEYGGNSATGQTSVYVIKFQYKASRIDEIEQYVLGCSVHLDKLLEKININFQSQILETYTLVYEENFYSRLVNVGYSVGVASEAKLNPIVVQWNSENDHIVNNYNFNKISTTRDIDHFFLDINGDGRTDDISVEYSIYEHSGHVAKKAESWYFRLREINNGFSIPITLLGDPSMFYQHLMVGDFNGDGRQDFLELKYITEKKEKTIVNRLFLSQGNSFTECVLNATEWWQYNRPEFRVGDFDGDGISELLIAYKNIPENYDNDPGNDIDNVHIWKFNEAAPYTQSVFIGKLNFGNTNFDKSVLLVGDFNGDGRSDVLRTAEWGSAPGGSNTSDCLIYRVDITTNSFNWIYGSGYPTVWHQIFPADFNGDGITDLLTYNSTAVDPTWEAMCFNGSTGFVSISLPYLWDYDPNSFGELWSHSLNLADYNGDGKSDIMQLNMILDPLEPYNALYEIYYSNGNNFSESSSGEIRDLDGFAGLGKVISEHTFAFCDFNGDNKADLYTLGVTGIDYIHEFDVTTQLNLVKSFTNGLGHKTEIQYTPLTSNTVYTKGTDQITNVINIQPALYAVSSVTSDNGVGGQYIVEYLYEGAKVHRLGKGFLGFDKLTTLGNPGTDHQTKSITSYTLNEEYYFRWPQSGKSYARVSGTDVIINETLNEPPVVQHFGDKRIFYYTPRSLTKVNSTGDAGSSFVKTTLTKQSYSSDDIGFGNLTSATVLTDPDDNLDFSTPEQAYDFYTKADFTYDVDEPNWLISRVKTAQTSTWDKTDATIDIQKNVFEYYTASPLVQHKTHIPNLSTPMTTVDTYSYDDYGNLTQSISSAHYFSPAPPQRITNYTYSEDYQHRFVTETKNTLDGVDYITSTTYDPAMGLPLTSTDLNGLVTAYEYDGFGRLQQTTYPDGVIDINRLFWANGNPDIPDNGLYYSWSKRSGEQEVLSFFDQLGRNLKTVSLDIKDQKVFAETKYDQFGRVSQTSNPHYSTSDLLWTTYEYLTTGAVKKVTAPTATIEYTYNGRITTTNNTTLGMQTSKEANAIGQVIKATDPGGSINYTYYSTGQPKAITAGGRTTYLYYDVAGFQEKLIEPDAGTILYDYNPFGELISQTNANGHTYTMTYNGLGRITNKTLQGSLDDITDYVYCPAGINGFGQLQSVSGSNGIQTVYSYDNKGRVTEKNQYIKGERYTFTYDYNVYGKTNNITWPTGYAIQHRYKKGYLSAVVENNTENRLWELTDVNARGQVTQFQLGNGLLTTKRYNDYGFPETIYTEGGVQDLAYEFNHSSGNLTQRKSTLYPPFGNHTLTEDFTYDEDGLNNRLLTWRVGSGTLYSVDYAANGNINTKTGVGTYEYGTTDAGPHAVSRITTPAADYLAMAKTNKQVLTYTGFDKTSTLWQGDPAHPELANTLEITYGPGQTRKQTKYYRAGTLQQTKTFVDATYEIETDAAGHQRHLHYLSGGDGLFAIYTLDEKGDEAMYYIHKDYQGSFEAITNHKGTPVEKLSYDPWGRRRNPTNWTFTNVPEIYLFDRGYTGHEHLDQFGLINMNGRMYDPMLGRFLSPDNYVQAPDYTQNFNRYSYVLNNPLKYTDPSGEVWNLVIGAAIGGVSNWVMNGAQFNAKGLAHFGIGAAAGAIGVGAGALVSSAVGTIGFAGGAMTGAAGGFAGGFAAGAGNAWLGGSSFRQGLGQGLAGGGISAASGGLLGGLSGGYSATKRGGDYWNGSITDEFIVPSEITKQVSDYNTTSEADINDELLKARMYDQFNVEEGDFNIKKITTKSSQGYDLASSGIYINKKSGASVGGYLRRFSNGSSKLHVSPYYTAADDVAFRSVAGHELIHAYHHYSIPNFISVFSERVAYKYTYDTYMEVGQWPSAVRVNWTASSLGYWGTYPSQYEIPKILNW